MGDPGPATAAAGGKVFLVKKHPLQAAQSRCQQAAVANASWLRLYSSARYSLVKFNSMKSQGKTASAEKAVRKSPPAAERTHSSQTGKWKWAS
mgnify:CR=1 FL=1